MTKLELGPELLTGIGEIDHQHRVLVAWGNYLLSGNVTTAGAAAALAFLAKYTDTHFRAEELAMQLFDYPTPQPHVREHDAFRRKAEDLAHEAAAGRNPADMEPEIRDFLVRWISLHLANADADLARFLAETGRNVVPAEDVDPTLRNDPEMELALSAAG